jgi:aconitate hydratase
MNSFDSKAVLASGLKKYTVYRLPALAEKGFDLSRLPFSLKILLENLLRREDGVNVTAGDICFLANWDAKAEPSREIAYMPARVLMRTSRVCRPSLTSAPCVMRSKRSVAIRSV